MYIVSFTSLLSYYQLIFPFLFNWKMKAEYEKIKKENRPFLTVKCTFAQEEKIFGFNVNIYLFLSFPHIRII